MNSTNPAVVTMDVTNNNDVWEFEFHLDVRNRSSTPWEGIAIQLVGPGGVDLPGLDLDYSDYDPRTTSSTVTLQASWGPTAPIYPDSIAPTEIIWQSLPSPYDNGIFGNGRFYFRIDLPDHPTMDNYSFDVLFSPIVPEPASVGMLIMGGLALTRRYR